MRKVPSKFIVEMDVRDADKFEVCAALEILSGKIQRYSLHSAPFKITLKGKQIGEARVEMREVVD